MNQSFIYLASSSPRRRELLEQLGVRFRVHAVEIDETHHDAEPASDYVRRLSAQKAAAAVASLGKAVPVLAADTVVVIDDEPLGKPRDTGHAFEMLKRLSNRSHSVLTAVTTISATGQQDVLNETVVQFREISDQELASYCASGEPADKAGAYAIQGLGAVFVKQIVGSYSGVVGLPLFETAQMLSECGINVLGLADA